MEELEIILEVENTGEQTIDILQEEVKEIHPIYEQLDITPSIQKQEYKGSFDKVTVAGDEDLKPENIKEGINIFGVEGSAKTTNVKITDCTELFSYNRRTDYVYEIIKLCDKPIGAQRMFGSCTNLTSLDLSDLDTSNFTDMKTMFGSCTNLTSLDVSNFNTSKVTTMQSMFFDCRNLTSLDLSNFDTSNVTDMYGMFSDCRNLTSLDVSNFNTSKVTTMSRMFYSCKNLTELDLSNFDTSNVIDVTYMFSQNDIKTVDLSSFDLSKVTNVDSMFYASFIENVKSFKNLGKGYVEKTENYSKYKLNLSSTYGLTYDSLMSFINNLYDLNLTYNVANGGTLYRQELKLGYTHKAKLTEEEIAIATNKGWNVT